MKYLPIRELGTVASALNFSTPDSHVIGGCDIYTTKAAGSDKKLYKNIENTLESQYESLVRLSASLSPPYISEVDDATDKDGHKEGSRRRSLGIPDIDLSRNSPFGTLSKSAARKTFAYLIATLNASHPDYDFSHTLRPTDFRKERSLRGIMRNVDTTLQNMRPNKLAFAPASYQGPTSQSAPPASAAANSDLWSPKMWGIIDKEMGLKHCEKYSYVPDDDPFDGEEGAIWSMHYFFFNKEKKRVCYLYLRSLSVISHSPLQMPMQFQRNRSFRRMSLAAGEGPGKRATYWLGSYVGSSNIDTKTFGPNDDDDDFVIAEPNDDEVEIPDMELDDIRSDLVDGYNSYDEDEYDDNTAYSNSIWRPRLPYVRDLSEEIGESMDM